jgi:hypothetical protein
MALPTRQNKTKLFLAVGIIGLFAVLIGFSTTFLVPLSKGSFHAPLLVHVHAALAFGWICLFIFQTILIQTNNYKRHRQLGILGVLIAAGIVITLIPVGLFQVEKDLRAGLGQTAISSLIGTITSGIIFASLVVAGVLKRREPSSHKQLLLLATILLLWPAWFRFRHIFPFVPKPEIWFAVVLADSLIVLSIVWHRSVTKTTSPILLYIGLFIIIEHAIEVYLFDTTHWRSLANLVYGVLT